MKAKGFSKLVTHICILMYSLIVYSCENSKAGSIVKTYTPLTNVERQHLIDSCLNKMNTELLELLSKPTELKTYLALSDSDIEKINAKSLKKLSKRQKEAMLEKISSLISNETSIPITCNIQDKIRVEIGDLALITLYTIEPYPYAAALGDQWCTGAPISNEIHLPYNLISFGMKDKMQKHYKLYLKSDLRKERMTEKYH